MNIKLRKHTARPQKQNTTQGSVLGDLSVDFGGHLCSESKIPGPRRPESHLAAVEVPSKLRTTKVCKSWGSRYSDHG